jgi:hypothetical protein
MISTKTGCQISTRFACKAELVGLWADSKCFLGDCYCLPVTHSNILVSHRQAKKKKLTAAEEAELAIKNKRDNAATRIQAMARGVASRVQFRQQLPYLRKSKQMRGFCVECETKVATKRCRVCKDNYCDVCFTLVHKKGALED